MKWNHWCMKSGKIKKSSHSIKKTCYGFWWWEIDLKWLTNTVVAYYVLFNLSFLTFQKNRCPFLWLASWSATVSNWYSLDRFVQHDEYPIMKFYISWRIITGNHCNWVDKSGILNSYTICLNINSKVMFICVLNNPYKMNCSFIEQTVCPKNHDALLNFFITKIYPVKN